MGHKNGKMGHKMKKCTSIIETSHVRVFFTQLNETKLSLSKSHNNYSNYYNY